MPPPAARRTTGPERKIDRHWTAEVTRSITTLTRLTHSMRLHEAMGKRAGLTIRPYLFRVLSCVKDVQPARLSDVADEIEYDRSTVSRHVAELVALGCVERLADPTDGRAVILRLTKEGERAIRQVFDAWDAFVAEVTLDWTATDRAAFLTLLQGFETSFVEHVVDLDTDPGSRRPVP